MSYSLPKVVGDGLNDDTQGIQEALDRGLSSVYLPPPPKHYVISRTLRIHSHQSLVLDRFTVIRLAPHSDCLMITNDDQVIGNEQISVTGGIWDMDNVNQAPNPIWKLPDTDTPEPYDSERYLGICMRFVGVQHLTLQSVTFRDPVTFCTQLARQRYFTIDDITLDIQHCNPVPLNIDGIHLDGHCRFGRITNIRGTTNDDLIALNADDGGTESPCFGPIEDIAIDGLYATDCHSAIRMLSSGSPVRRISVANVFGTYYEYAIAFTKFFHSRQTTGQFDAIALRNIHCSKAPRYPEYHKDSLPPRAVIWCERGTHIGTLTIDGLHRHEEAVATPTIQVDEGAEIDTLVVENVSQISSLQQPFETLENHGIIRETYPVVG